MSGEEDLYLNQSEAEALFFPDALLGNADELDFETFGDASGLDDGTFNGVTGPSLTSFETRDIFKSTVPNGDSFVDEVEAKCDSNSIAQQEVAANGAPYSNGTLHTNYMFNKPTLDVENMAMPYSISGLYLQGNGVTGLGSPSSPSVSQSGLMSPSMVASEKLNGLTLGQMAPSYCPSSFETKTTSSMGFPPGMAFSSAIAMPVNAGTKSFLSSPQTSPVAQVVVVPSQPTASGLSRFGSQEILMSAAESNGLSQSTSPVLSPNSSDGKEQVERLIAAENGMKMSQEKQYYGIHRQGVMQQERVVDTANFVDQVDGDGDGLQPLPQMTRPSMQRSFSSHALGQLRHMNSAPHSSENGVNSRQSQMDRSGGLTSPGARLQPNLAEFQSMRPMMRRVYSAGDIQTLNGMQGGLSGSASPNFEDGSYRVGKYSMEERKIRIHRYQQKRTQRNFNKKIKYACRKTLADSRPRVRGRFAKNMDDDLPTVVLGRKREDDDDEEGDAHVGGEANAYLFENSSGEYSDMLSSIKLEHRRVDSM